MIIFDKIFLIFFAILWVPIFILLSILAFLFNGWPIFFVQERVGYKGKIFLLYKFRSMRIDTSSRGGSFDAGSTIRITKFGRILRKSKLDELPQFINVLKGDMGLVGPRPEVKKWVEAYPKRWQKIHTVRPGITDPASIVYRNEEKLLAASVNPDETYRNEVLIHKLDLYEKYVQNRSFFGNLKIIVQTVIALFK